MSRRLVCIVMKCTFSFLFDKYLKGIGESDDQLVSMYIFNFIKTAKLFSDGFENGLYHFAFPQSHERGLCSLHILVSILVSVV